MLLKLIRETHTNTSTISRLYINDVFECFVLEDTDRALKSSMPLPTLQNRKVYGKTAIPEGSYEIAITFSNRFKQYLPLLLSVPAYEGIRIHAGNKAEHTEGCLLPGTAHSTDTVLNSKAAFRSLFAKLKSVERKEKIIITISSL